MTASTGKCSSFWSCLSAVFCCNQSTTKKEKNARSQRNARMQASRTDAATAAAAATNLPGRVLAHPHAVSPGLHQRSIAQLRNNDSSPVDQKSSAEADDENSDPISSIRWLTEVPPPRSELPSAQS